MLFSDESVFIDAQRLLSTPPSTVATFGVESFSLPLNKAAHLVTSTPSSLDLAENPILLGRLPAPMFASMVPKQNQAQFRDTVQCAGWDWVSVRKCLPSIENHSALIGLGKSMLQWHASSQFCGKCGSRTISADGGVSRRCSSAPCKETAYPRINPCAIMLVLDGHGKCLLGRNKDRPFFSTLAGFCSHGEAIEETVRREVMEEAGVGVSDVVFYRSQSWPFPFQLMIGFHAVARDPSARSITVDPNELEDAKWFTKEETLQMLDGRHPSGFVVPPAYSISHQLIRSWVEGEVDDEGQPTGLNSRPTSAL